MIFLKSILPYLFLCIFVVNPYAKTKKGIQFTFQSGYDYIYDENISDSWTGASASYSSPWILLGVQKSFLKHWKGFSKVRIRKENQMDLRSLTLNSPFSNFEVGINWSRLKLWTFGGSWQRSETLAPNYSTVKVRHQYSFYSLLKPKFLRFKNTGIFEVENYGDSAQDGRTFWYRSNLDFPISIHKKTFSITPSLYYKSENRASVSKAYTYWKRTEGFQLSSSIFFTKIQSSLWMSQKDYSLHFSNEKTGNLTQKMNSYFGYSFGISAKIFSNLRADFKQSQEKVQSNQAGYSYFDRTWKLGITSNFKYSPNP